MKIKNVKNGFWDHRFYNRHNYMLKGELNK